MKRIIVLLIVSAVAMPAFSGSIYKCKTDKGNTYQDSPCKVDAPSMHVTDRAMSQQQLKGSEQAQRTTVESQDKYKVAVAERGKR